MTTPTDTSKLPAELFIIPPQGREVVGDAFVDAGTATRAMKDRKASTVHRYILAPSPQESHKLAEELERLLNLPYDGRSPLGRSAGVMNFLDKHRDAILAALRSSPSEQTPSVDDMVNRFLGWPLPKTFAPDCGISFDGRKDDEWNKNKTWPIGTNLFTADEARAMFEHAIAASGGAKGDGNG